MSEPKQFKKIFAGAPFFGGGVLALLLVVLLIRGAEAYLISSPGGDLSLWRLQGRGALADVTFVLGAGGLLYFPFIGLYLLRHWLGKAFLLLAVFGLALMHSALLQYFLDTYQLMGSLIFRYDLADMAFVTRSSVDFNYFSTLLLLMPLLVLPLTWLLRLPVRASRVVVVILLLLLLPTLLLPSPIPPREYQSPMEYYQTQSKAAFFIADAIEYFFVAADEGRDFEPFPLLEPWAYPDVLGPFFEKNDTPPNLVFVMVESLGSNLSGPDAYYPSLTPFLDSLARHSLYFPNFLAHSQRTFGLLPSSLASVPLHEEGFTELGERMPPHLSLPAILERNGYYTGFYYGGWAGFTRMKYFLRYQGLDTILAEEHFPDEYHQHQRAQFGFHDEDLFNRYFEWIGEDSLQQPYLHLLLTLSNHEPFEVPQQERYLQMLHALQEDFSGSPAQLRHLKQHPKAYSSLFYLDEQLREFMEQYEGVPGYQNTIFFIFGDHRMNTPTRHMLDFYHVPLIIYSPRLKEAKTIEAVSSQRNLPPSIAAFLHEEYDLKVPETTHWEVGVLDTGSEFRNQQEVLMMRLDKRVKEYLYKDYLLTTDATGKDQLMKLKKGLDVQPLDDEQKLQHLLAKRDSLQALYVYATENWQLIPEDQLLDFLQPEYLSQYPSLQTQQQPLVLAPGQEWYSLIPQKEVEGVKRIVISVSLEVAAGERGDLPLIAFSLKDAAGEIIEWKSVNFDEAPEASLLPFPVRHIQLLDVPQPDSTYIFSVDIWNQAKAHVVLEDISVNAYGLD